MPHALDTQLKASSRTQATASWRSLSRLGLTALTALIGAGMWVNSCLPACAQDLGRPYFPPGLSELARAQQHSLRVPNRVNVNRANLQELMTLPGVTESIALSLVRLRPFRGFDDLSRIQASLSRGKWLQLRQELSNRISF